jgi:hypothetical protein
MVITILGSDVYTTKRGSEVFAIIDATENAFERVVTSTCFGANRRAILHFALNIIEIECVYKARF